MTQTPLRADAAQNRLKIISAASSQIRESGPDVSMEQIATAAGVAVGTLYRHFPNKEELVRSILATYVQDIATDISQAVERAQKGSDPWEELVNFLSKTTESTATHHATKVAASRLGLEGNLNDQAEVHAASSLQKLLQIGIDQGKIRQGVSVSDIYLLVGTAPADQSPDIQARWLELILPGLAAPE